MNYQNAKKVVLAVLKAGRVPMLLSAPGVGKTSVIGDVHIAFAKWLGLVPVLDNLAPKSDQFSLVVMRIGLFQSIDFGGVPVPVEKGDGKYIQIRAMLENLPTCGAGFLYLNEYPQGDRATQAAARQLMLENRLGDYHLPPGWRVVVDGNRQQDRAGSTAPLSIVTSSTVLIQIDPDPREWCAWAESAGIRTEVTSWIAWQGGAPENFLLNFDPRKSEPFTCPRSLHILSDVLDELDELDVPEAVAVETYKGIVGEAAAEAANVFFKLYRVTLPCIDEAIKNPLTAELPVGAGVGYVVSAAMVKRTKIDPSIFANCYRYIERFADGETPEMLDFYVRTALAAVAASGKDPLAITSTQVYSDHLDTFRGLYAA
jgi:hypothetical protein